MSPRLHPTHSHGFRTLALVALVAGLCACSDEGGALEGSVSPLLDLKYKRAEAVLAEGELSINFVSPQGSGVNTVLKVSARVGDMIPEGYTGGLTINLAEALEGGAQRGVIGRSVLDEPARVFPQLERGSLVVDNLPTAQGQRVTGDFHVTFVNGIDIYSGRTIFGSFEATVP
ncbi:hypothetical protein [Myxococcus llanfairpwllgwyngyllgogerychwyrndrobwllllantysiliogogogochensis]|uniref:Lipoprotein n=1 Tax=Myxococcus llanfairpwllgwyngyllgogerychwyrndrobwllllantysiliogogogochensis TaxID=2590453 RepID=A0A540X587_9BACT|nr:hypothetical protein [Myxococcus llanfairpwllgwyngyllgogerychwyrndrobwllllantysiliogogogochensis]NTX05044.1 hypothetical protein [Myxococcus sp. CA040A]TQF16389.1 hypothetical protein FJV41_08500 [Myxococcus llanfairpwllgwyngyllgogerychwyrndrobwllllantysiliogogogochensis]